MLFSMFHVLFFQCSNFILLGGCWLPLYVSCNFLELKTVFMFYNQLAKKHIIYLFLFPKKTTENKTKYKSVDCFVLHRGRNRANKTEKKREEYSPENNLKMCRLYSTDSILLLFFVLSIDITFR